MLTACSRGSGAPASLPQESPADVTSGEKKDPGSMAAGVAESEKLEAVDTVIVVDVNTDEGYVILQNSTGGSRYELTYDGRTTFFDKYGSALSAAQIKPGDIADIRLSVHSGYLRELSISDRAFYLKNLENYSFNENKRMFSTGLDNYRLPQRLVVLVDGRVGDIRDICDGDILTVAGIGRELMTCRVEQGHGYIKVRGQNRFIGGWISVGRMVVPVSEDMLLTVPEGSQELRISYKGRGGSLQVEVERDREKSVDVSGLKDELLRTAKVTFDIKPSIADLYINGEKTDFLLPVELEHGVYRIKAQAPGYASFENNISVGGDNPTLKIELEEDKSEEDEDEDEKKDSSSASGDGLRYVVPPPDTTRRLSNDESSSSSMADMSSSSSARAAEVTYEETLEEDTDEYDDSSQEGTYYEDEDDQPYLSINEPSGCEVYYDGSYKGMSPLKIKKESGTHVITLRRDGYRTKSYTVTLGDDRERESFSFPELVSE